MSSVMPDETQPSNCLPVSSSVSVGWTASTLSTDFDQSTNLFHPKHTSYTYTPGRQSALLPNRIGPPGFLPIEPGNTLQNSNTCQRSITSPLTFSSESFKTQTRHVQNGETIFIYKGSYHSKCNHSSIWMCIYLFFYRKSYCYDTKYNK